MSDGQTCANPVLLGFIKEWMDIARERNSKGYYMYRKAYDSLKAHPEALRHPCETKNLKNIGEILSARLTSEYQRYCDENGLVMPSVPRGKSRKRKSGEASTEEGTANGEGLGEEGEEGDAPSRPKKPRKQTPYVPAKRSGGYALLLTLYEGHLEGPGRGVMAKQQLIDSAQKYCDSSFTAPSDPGKCYTAWNSMKLLVAKELVQERGNPRKYLMSDVGEEVARGIWMVEKGVEGEKQVEGEREGGEGRSTVSIAEKGEGGRKGKEKEKGKENSKGKESSFAKAAGKRRGKATATATASSAGVLPVSELSKPPTRFKESGFDTAFDLDDDEWGEFRDNLIIPSHQPTLRQNTGNRLGNTNAGTSGTMTSGTAHHAVSELSKPPTRFKGSRLDTTFDFDDDEWGEFRDNSVIPSHQPTLRQNTGNRLGNTNAGTSGTMTSGTAHHAVNLADENDAGVQRRLRLDAIDRRLSLSSQPEKQSTKAASSTRGASTGRGCEVFDLTLSSSSPPRLPPSPPRPLSTRDLNRSLSYSTCRDVAKQAEKRPQTSRSTSQQPPHSITKPNSTRPLFTAAASRQTQLPSVPEQAAPARPRPQSTVTFPPFTPTAFHPGTFTIHLILDNREVRTKSDRTYLQDELKSRGVVPLTRSLHIGDALWIAKDQETGTELVLDHIVERKRMDDLVGSIKDGRFHEQKWRLKRSGVKNIIYLIEDLGSYYTANTASDSAEAGYMYDSIHTAISSTQVVNGFFVKRTAKVDDTIRYLCRMTHHLTELYSQKTLYAIPSHLIDSKTYTTNLLPHVQDAYPGKDFYPEYGAFNEMVDKSASLTYRDLYLKMLMCTRGVSAEKAMEIQKRWRTPRELLDAFERSNGTEERREMVMKGVDESGTLLGRRKIGRALSVKIMEVWWGKE